MTRIGDDDRQRFMAFARVMTQEQTALAGDVRDVYEALLTTDSAALAGAAETMSKRLASMTSRAITFKALAESIRDQK